MNKKTHNNNGQFKKGINKEDHPRFTDQAGRIRMRCPHCLKEVRVKPYDYKRSKSKVFYCSWEHYKAGSSVIIKCEHCGKEKKLSKSDLKIKNRGQFCSRSCRGKVLSKGKRNTQWNGGKHINTAGYVLIYNPKHPFANKNYVLEHRLVMEEYMGRYLTEELIVHHINEIKNDNRIENLKIMSKSEHTTHHNNIRWGNK